MDVDEVADRLKDVKRDADWQDQPPVDAKPGNIGAEQRRDAVEKAGLYRSFGREDLGPGDRALPPVFRQRYGSITPGDRGGIVVPGTTLNAPLD